jgi:anthranilate phosphoribosyltransferase
MSALLEALETLVEKPNRRLTRQHLQEVARELLTGQASTARIAAFLTALRMVGETSLEIEAFVQVMLDTARAFPRPKVEGPILDTCGTGGDGHNTFNISTASALIVAAAGVKVAKHGNRSASSQCGSADVLEALGYNIDQAPEAAARQLVEKNFCFLFARSYHPAMRHAAEARKELGMRTLFNLCGPLSNPARPTHQVVGVASRDLIEPMAGALRMLGCRGALVVRGADGMDEISLSQVTEGLLLDGHGSLRPWSVAPADLHLRPIEMADIVGGDAQENAELVRAVLEGRQGPHADVVNLNAAAALWICGVEREYGQAFAHARDVQRSGKAARLLDELVKQEG